jgi:S-adenosylmethionine hydrolase
VDRFGNVQLSARAEHLTAAGLDDALMLEVMCRGRGAIGRRATTFGDVIPGELALIVDSGGWVAVVVNHGSAAEALGLAPGDPVTLTASR